MSDRSVILGKLRRVTLDRRDLPVVEGWRSAPADPVRTFTESLLRMGGEILPDGEDLVALVHDRYGAGAAVLVPRPEPGGRFEAAWTDRNASSFADLDVVIVRAAFGVAETGSVCLTEGELGVEALGYLPQHLLVLLDPVDVVADLHAAYARPEWHQARYGVLQSGPSATADIEGVLIRGAQGVRSLTVAFRTRPEEGRDAAASAQGEGGASSGAREAASGSDDA